MSALTGALERRAWIQTNASKLYPNLFVLLVAPPGVGKDQVIVPMRELWAETGLFNIAPISMTHKGMIDQLADAQAHKQIENPEGGWLSYHSLLIAVPEFGVLIPSYDLGFLSALNELYNCWDLYEERTRMKGEVLRIERPHIQILSGTQPKYLGALFPEAAYGMGFTSRIIMVYSGAPVRVSLFDETASEDRGLRKDLVKDLTSIGKLAGPFTVDKDAIHSIEDWHKFGCEKDKPAHSKLIHYNARRIMHVLKLSMAFSVSRTGNLIISLEDFEKAKELLIEAEYEMPQIFKEISSGGQAAEIEEAFLFVTRIYMKSGQKAVPEHRLIHFLSSRVPTNQISFIIDTMVHSNIIKEISDSKLNLPSAYKTKSYVPLGLHKTE